MNRVSTLLARFEKAGTIAEDTILVTILCGMILLAAGQIFFRNLFGVGVFWGDELLRIMVLWIAVAGGVAASRADKHLSIAVLNHFLSSAWQTRIGLLTNLFTAIICGFLCWYGIEYVYSSYVYEDRVLGGLPAWIFQIIVPAGFGLIAWRYLLHAVTKAKTILSPEANP